jgi:hypothetical protein
MEFKYKITKFDAENKTVVVVFDDGAWAEIRLANPLPPTIEDLEKIIKTYTAPKEVIEAQLAPSADLSYIDALIDIERTAERFSLTPPPPPPSDFSIPVVIVGDSTTPITDPAISSNGVV